MTYPAKKSPTFQARLRATKEVISKFDSSQPKNMVSRWKAMKKRRAKNRRSKASRARNR